MKFRYRFMPCSRHFLYNEVLLRYLKGFLIAEFLNCNCTDAGDGDGDGDGDICY